MKKQYKEDIEYMIKKLEEKHISLYYNIDKSSIMNMLFDAEIKNDYDFYYHISKILSKFNDAHVMCNPGKEMSYVYKRPLPLEFAFLGGSVYIMKIADEYENFRFGEVLAINNVPIKQIIEDYIEITPNILGSKEAEIERMLNRRHILTSLPSINTDTKNFTFLIKTKNGKKSLDINLEEHNIKKYTYTEQNDEELYSFEYLEEHNIMFISYKLFKEMEDYSMDQFISDIKAIAFNKNCTDFILDIRGNKGGNSSLARPLIEYLSNPNYKIMTLMDKRIFSSAKLMLISLKRIGSKFIGEPLGAIINRFGEVRHFSLPSEKLTIEYVTKYFYLKDGKIGFLTVKSERLQATHFSG